MKRLVHRLQVNGKMPFSAPRSIPQPVPNQVREQKAPGWEMRGKQTTPMSWDERKSKGSHSPAFRGPRAPS